MNIDTVIANLENTIHGKEVLLKSIQSRSARNADSALVIDVSSHYLALNLHELNNVLVDCRKVKESLGQ